MLAADALPLRLEVGSRSIGSDTCQEDEKKRRCLLQTAPLGHGALWLRFLLSSRGSQSFPAGHAPGERLGKDGAVSSWHVPGT